MSIIVINPNSSKSMTEDIQKAALSFSKGRFDIKVVLTNGAPEFIDTLEDKVLAAPGMLKTVRQFDNVADAFVVACACDPNVKLLREITVKPVIGIGEASMYFASMLGNSFSILQTDHYSVPNKINLVHEYHMEKNLASVKYISNKDGDIFEQYLLASRSAIEDDGAEVIILGCAGLCGLTDSLSKQLGVPVLDGVACGLAMAEGLVNLGYYTSKIRYYSAGIN